MFSARGLSKWLGLLAVIGFAVLSAGCRPSPTPTPTPTPTPFIPPTPPPTAADVGLGPAPVTSLAVVHQPFGDGACGACHDLRGSDPRQMWGAIQEVCRQCHWQDVPDPDRPLAHPHAPFARGECLTCHLPHAGAHPKLLVAPVTQLCNDCHQDHGGIVQQPHPQVAQGECNLCHLAHGSMQPALLRQPQKVLCGVCHPDPIDPQRSFAAHAEAPELTCTSCHAPHDPAAQPAQVTRASCVTCHADLPVPADFRFPHKPFAEERCAECHPSFHRDPDRPLLAATQSQSCNACHGDHGLVVTQTHPQVAKGECRLCHDGHGSNHPNQLIRPEADICQSCHGEVFAATAFAGHAATQLPACTSCHSPHVPQTAGPAVAMACATCHQDILAGRSQHKPVSQGECKACHSEFHGQQPTQLAAVQTVCTDCHQLEKGSIAHPPYQQGRCETCHVVHTSPHTALLNRAPTQLCGTCHVSQTAAFGRSRHAAHLTAQCAACHQAHDGSIDNLLHARTNALCDTCHRHLPHGFHPVSGGRDPVRGGELSCISCHAPHGSPHRADLRAPGDGLCLSCHRFEQPPTARR